MSSGEPLDGVAPRAMVIRSSPTTPFLRPLVENEKRHRRSVTPASWIQGLAPDVKPLHAMTAPLQSSVNEMRPRFFATSHAGFDAFRRRLSARPSIHVIRSGSP